MRIVMMRVVSRALIEKETDRKWHREKWQRGSKKVRARKDREHTQISERQFIRECSLIDWSTVRMIFIFIWLIHVDSSYNFCVWCKVCVCVFACACARDLISFQEFDKGIGVSLSIESHSSFHIWALSCIHYYKICSACFISFSPPLPNWLVELCYVCVFVVVHSFGFYTLAFALSISIYLYILHFTYAQFQWQRIVLNWIIKTCFVVDFLRYLDYTC